MFAKKNDKKIYLEALKYTLFLSAALHMIILVIFLPFNKNIGTLNYFKLTGIDLLLPDIMEYKYVNLISLLFMFILYVSIIKLKKRKTKNKTSIKKALD